ncbi:MAG TPA: sugar phosphate isomerase/epimerase family protein [Acidimicrobiales bacterium]|nr:sugar phosphate isomerase/epimerase family protein [Acidimicrobiales bacterium]
MQLRNLGHTGITWPFTPAGAKQAIREVADLNYSGIELFGFVIDAYPGGTEAVRADLEEAGLGLAAAYCPVSLVEPSERDTDLASMERWAAQVAQLGGEVVVVGPSPRRRDHYDADDYRHVCSMLNEIAKRCLALGVTACFHPHTGTPVESRQEIAQVMDNVDAGVVRMAPDTGQIAKGGADPVEVVGTYASLIRHIHLKDYVGGTPVVAEGKEVDRTGWLDYVPLGRGVVDVAAIIKSLGREYPGWWMVELDGTDASPEPARMSAATSKQYLEAL